MVKKDVCNVYDVFTGMGQTRSKLVQKTIRSVPNIIISHNNDYKYA